MKNNKTIYTLSKSLNEINTKVEKKGKKSSVKLYTWSLDN